MPKFGLVEAYGHLGPELLPGKAFTQSGFQERLRKLAFAQPHLQEAIATIDFYVGDMGPYEVRALLADQGCFESLKKNTERIAGGAFGVAPQNVLSEPSANRPKCLVGYLDALVRALEDSSAHILGTRPQPLSPSDQLLKRHLTHWKSDYGVAVQTHSNLAPAQVALFGIHREEKLAFALAGAKALGDGAEAIVIECQHLRTAEDVHRLFYGSVPRRSAKAGQTLALAFARPSLLGEELRRRPAPSVLVLVHTDDAGITATQALSEAVAQLAAGRPIQEKTGTSYDLNSGALLLLSTS